MTNSRQVAGSRQQSRDLDALGIPPADASVYTALLGHPRTRAVDLAEQCGLSAQQATRALSRLTASGMASRVPGRPARYLAAAPDIALGALAAERAAELRSARAMIEDLMEVHREASRFTHPAELVEVVTGAENLDARVRRLQDEARTQIRGFDRPPYVSVPGENLDLERQRLRAGVVFRVIYDREAIAYPGRLQNDILLSGTHGERSRVRPQLPIKMVMADEEVAVIPISSSPHVVDAAYIIHASALLDALVTLFEAEWDRAVPITEALTDPAPERDPETTTLLTLLAAGQTDAGIGRALGWSPRTTQRRVQRLMTELNATTRFQAGMNAKDRGWL
ncbi:helix-turn-helix domain-containing protein [Amycolatopsis rhabdoformis]|uniref:Helix-turn-helix domain-containing protein n=1 Tax=Amycolatopsis rhabdoformis TaxID=1448059 RepID=A0ABZ1II01_9PSEU|nr:helix-turn-helix domain-containing protein [Amycolatopsis rhabdoformis]WSE33793.1 helix-turn-helix domain-containing protein [Amycolatopsis rhabdoformis]